MFGSSNATCTFGVGETLGRIDGDTLGLRDGNVVGLSAGSVGAADGGVTGAHVLVAALQHVAAHKVGAKSYTSHGWFCI